MTLVLTIVAFAAFFSFLSLTYEIHQIVEELQVMRRLFIEYTRLLKPREPDENPF